MLITIDGAVYKYDIATKDLLFSFKAQAYKSLQLFSNDELLITSDSGTIKLWGFYGKEEAPDLITSAQTTIKVD